MAKKDIGTEIDLSDRSDDQLRQLVAVGTVISTRANDIVKEAKKSLMDRIEPGEHPQAVFGGVSLGELTRTKGGNEGKYKVADPVAFGAWLKKNGLDDYYEPMSVATADACDAGWLRNLIEKDFEGELPDGVTRVDVPTATVWSITRTVLSGNEDLPNVYAIQEQMQLLPLSAYVQGGEYAAPQGAYKEENDFVPINKVLSMTPAEFFNTANALMQVNPPADADEELLKKLSAINVGAGKTFDAALLGEGAAERWTQMLQGLRATLAADGAKYAQKLGQWIYYGKPIGDFGTEYTYRAMVALVGLGANTVDVAIYPKTTVDENGAALTGEKTYTIHFETLPPTLEGGFWSVTAYGEDDFLIDNSIDRYCINDRSDFKLNADGTLDIILSKDAPEDTSNWLPVSDGEFHLFMRIYVPDMTALDSWQPPVIREQ